MKEPDDDLRQEIALFRYGVIADLVHLPVGTPGTGATMRAKAGRSYVIPGTTRTRVAAETMRHWIADYRRGGFEALYPKPRTDRGKPRRLPPEVAERLIALKTDNPACSVRAIIKMAGDEGIDHPLAPSTVHRLLAREGLFDRIRPNAGADRRRFAYREAGELWMSDVMHGPRVRHGRTRRKTYLIAFIDDATRVVPFAAFATSENTSAFLPVFRNALIRRGLPQRLYVDNGSAYRSRHLALVCARLGVALIHARAFQPAGKGKIERWFRTLRAGWLGRAEAAGRETLETLNRGLWAWIEGEYHNTPHRGLEGRTPLEQWALASAAVRYPDATMDLDDLFLFEVRRPRPQGPHRQPERPRVRGRRGAGRREGHAALRPRGAAFAATRGGARRQARRQGHAPRRLRQHRRAAHLPGQGDRSRRAGAGAAALAAGHAQAQGQEGARVMYQKHFALTRLPFETPAQTDGLFESSARREAEARLGHLIGLRGIGLLTGEVGSGKTTVCRHLTAGLHPGLYRVHYVSLTTGNVLDIYKEIAWELGLPVERSRATARQAIRNEVSRLVTEAKQLPVLVIDEAHHLRNDVLEDLRLLTNFAMDAEQRLCLILVGLTELRRRLAMAMHESLAQRLVVRHHLTGLDRDEVDAYLTHRLRLAGCELPLFEAPAVEALFQSARGLPRQINRIAHYALSAAALDGARTVTAEHLQHALEELAP